MRRRRAPRRGYAGSGLAALSAACRAKGLSLTHQRLAVYEAVAATRSHPGAEEIFQFVRSKLPTISRGTVYRTLDTLRGVGLINEVRVGDAARYESAAEPHHHLVCTACRRIIDVHDASLEGLRPPRGTGSAADGFEVKAYQIQFTGLCRACRPRGGPGRSR